MRLNPGHLNSYLPTGVSAVREIDPVARVVETLSYRQSTIGAWSRAPEWARFFIQVGAAVGDQSYEEARIIVALVAPVRAFAAALCSVGAVLRLSVEPVRVDVERCFAELRALPVGTKVVYHTEDARIRHGALAGLDVIHDRECVVVDVGGGLLYKIPADRCSRLEVVGGEAPVRRRVASLHTVQAGLVTEAIGGNEGAAFLAASRLDCVIVAHERELRAEVLETPFALTSGDNRVGGCLQDLLRVKRFGRDGEPHRSDLVPTNWPVRREHREYPTVAIFDGANAYLRWGETWPRSHLIVVLDRRDSRFDDAVGQLDTAYIRDRVNGLGVHLPTVPPSIECMAFRTVRP